jgi:hypothetical protein
VIRVAGLRSVPSLPGRLVSGDPNYPVIVHSPTNCFVGLTEQKCLEDEDIPFHSESIRKLQLSLVPTKAGRPDLGVIQ